MLSGQMLAELVDAMKTARDSEDVRAVVLTGAGDKVFCAGADLGGFAADVPLVAKHFASDLFLEFFRLMPRLGKPSLCAANGHVLAGGMGLALSCDLVIAKEGATFGTPEINVGAFPYMIMAIIYRNVPRKKVNEMMLLGERLSAEQAVEYGLANKVVPAGGVRRRGRRLGRQAGLEEPGADAPRPRRDVPPAGHGDRRRARVPALPALAHLHAPRTSSRASPPSSRSATRSGKGVSGRHRARGEEPASGHRPAGGADRAAARAPREGEAGRRRGEDRQAARARQADRARADRPAGRRGHLRRARHPRPPALRPAGDGRGRGAGRRRHHRLGRRRRPPLAASPPTTSP